MIHIKVQYDAYNRRFKLVEKEFGALFEDDALYDLAIPFMFEDGDEVEKDNFTAAGQTPLAHA
jgi:hypothetical protein